ncbi:hypothetical protein K2173_000690 [Erythroxylum novogranatense]|uniref:NAC domain-containing protein n=1 Tax=Erythroxylum novogranatense TaxID=1862640 RepID=A0AAV8SIN1_9ROSI|nr:hypothetical protein K2173_000690 [Erythroxylum novogranatense]
MEKPSFVRTGGVKFPIGFRFLPTDEELLVHYLKPKVYGVPLPASIIPEFDVFQTDPWNLPGDVKERRYFFYKAKDNEISQGKRKRSVGSGCWKRAGKIKQVVASGSNQAVGTRKTLVFCDGKHSNETKTKWIMHEFRLGSSSTISNSYQSKIPMVNSENWVVYGVFQRKRKPRKHGVIVGNSLEDFGAEVSLSLGHSPPSSPCSSGITEVSNGSDKEEISSCMSKTT